VTLSSALQPRPILLFAYTALVYGVFRNNGMYDAVGLLFVILGFSFLVLAAVWTLQKKKNSLPSPLLACTLVLFLILGATKTPGIYLQSQLYAVLFFYTHIFLLLLTLLVYALPTSRWERVRPYVFFLAILFALIFQLLLPSSSPTPFVDVFVISQESAAHLLQGRNPYTTQTSDIYAGVADFGFHHFGYHYPPASLYLLAIGYFFFGDVRYTYVFALMVTTWILWKIARRSLPASSSELLTLLFLYSPRTLFVLEQAWTEPLLLLLFALSFFLFSRGYQNAASFAYGYMISLKQYLLFFLVHWLILERRLSRLILGLGVLLLTVLPFLILAPKGLWNSAMSPHLHALFRSDSLSISSLLYRLFDIKIWSLSGIFIGALCTPLTFFLFRKLHPLQGYLFAVSITTYAMFLFGNLAYANYYFFIGGMMLFLIAFSPAK